MLHIHNTLTKSKEPFQPIIAGKVGIYVCGMTVYDLCHIGHGRIFVVFDMIARYLRFSGYDVFYVRNITDIDDKIINRANESNVTTEELTGRFIRAMEEDEKSLGVLPPDEAPLATQHIPEIISMIERLLEKGIAYVADNGDVYYAVDQFPHYGELAHQDLGKLRAGHRVEITDVKKDPLDFALWKLAKPNEPSWDSPWGKGRPGWHIECSAMSSALLGNPFDIHGGGLDLVFPHHQNEIAQSEAANGCKMVNNWMHVGYVQVDREKMSKSLGNFFTIREVLKQYDAEVIRYFMLASHYRSPINYSLENLNSAKHGLQRLYVTLRDLNWDVAIAPQDQSYTQRFIDAMDDDFNTPEALAVIFDIAKYINVLKEEGDLDSANQYAALLCELAAVLGIAQQNPEAVLLGEVSEETVANIEMLISQRDDARANKDWQTADNIRQQLLDMGILLEDKEGGTQWRQQSDID